MGFLRRQIVTAALTVNAIRPVSGYRAGIPAFFAGWMTGELAPHVLGITLADAATHATGGRKRAIPLALAAASSAGLLHVINQSRQARVGAEQALVDGLGSDYVEELDELPTPADLAIPWRKLIYPFRMRNKQVTVERDIAYNEHGKRGMLDIYLPSGGVPEGGAPVLLQVHGGAWTIGKKEEQGLPLMNHLAAKGWVCVAINYRLAPRDPWPAHIVDVKQAIAWIREHIASYGGNSDYIAITGGSAGGHLSSLAALTANDPVWQPGFEEADTTVQVAVPHYGVYDLAGSTGLSSARLVRDGFLSPRIFQTTWEKDPEVFEAASPLLRVTPEAPDFFVLHGAVDTLVDVAQARLFVERLRSISKRSVVYAELPGAQHAFDIFPSIRSQHTLRAIDRYLHWHWNRHRRLHPAQHQM
ncbi:alpha/beta hydrolase [Nocardioides salsibiostraticola]